MPKFIGDVEITLKYTLTDVVVEAADEFEAEEKMAKEADEIASTDLEEYGSWDYDVELETACDECELALFDCVCFEDEEEDDEDTEDLAIHG